MAEDRIEIPPGMVAITTFGSVRAETAQSLGDMRARAMELGLKNINWCMIHGGLVDKARNESVRQMLCHKPKLEWLLFLDGDMVFGPALLELMLNTAFGTHKWADIVGGYAQLRGEPFLPTIDTGTGTWEFVDANTGVYEVIRTGGACALTKRHVYERMEYPWYGTRPTPRALDMLLEIDNFARCKLDGKNPFADMKEWDALLNAAAEEAGKQRTVTDGTPGWEYGVVGEDSNFADHAKALGFRIVVNTHAVLGHVDKKVISHDDMVQAKRKMEKQHRLLAGVTA